MTNEEMKSKLEQMLPTKRYLHSIGVAQEAISLAKKYNINEQKAYIAGLLHDCAKYIDHDESIKILEQSGITVSIYEKMSSGLLHAPLGAIIAEKEFEIEDKEILSAIKNHTTGKANMSDLDKIIYLADLIEPGRKYTEMALLREKVYENLNIGMFYGLDFSIRYILYKKSLIHPNTIEAYNYIRINNEEDLDIEGTR